MIVLLRLWTPKIKSTGAFTLIHFHAAANSYQLGFADQSQQSHRTLTVKLLNLLKQCLSIKPFQQIHTQMLINSVQKSNFLLSKIIDLKAFAYASLLFTQIPNPNEYAFNIMIRGLTTAWRNYSLTIQFYYQMKYLGLKPNNFTYPFLFISCANLSALEHGQTAHSMVFKIGLDDDHHVTHSLMTMYSKCGGIHYARQVFNEIHERDVVSWNSMISGYSKMGFAQEAVRLFTDMREQGFEPSKMTLVSLLGACGDLGDLALGQWVEGFVDDKKIELNSYVGSALIDMYGKCGDLMSARRFFDAMAKKDVVTWSAMITGCLLNDNTTQPNDITFVGVLSDCAHAGLVDDGRQLFNSMNSSFGLVPKIEHYSCTVDLLARAGHLYEVWYVIERMPGNPDAIILGSLLGACQKQRNVDVSERVIDNTANSI